MQSSKHWHENSDLNAVKTWHSTFPSCTTRNIRLPTPYPLPYQTLAEVLASVTKSTLQSQNFWISLPAINVMTLTAPHLSMLYTSLSKLQMITLIDQFLTQFALREKHSNQRVKLFDNKVLRRISGRRKEKVRLARVKLHSDRLRNLFSSLDVTWFEQGGWDRWGRYKAHETDDKDWQNFSRKKLQKIDNTGFLGAGNR